MGSEMCIRDSTRSCLVLLFHVSRCFHLHPANLYPFEIFEDPPLAEQLIAALVVGTHIFNMLLVTCYFSSVACFYKSMWSGSRGCNSIFH